MGLMNKKEEIRQSIFGSIKAFFSFPEEEFVPGKTKVRYSGAIYDEKEIIAIVDSLLDGWFGVRKKAREFEVRFSKFLGSKSSVVTNSGSSANLLAVSTLVSEKLSGHLGPGDEVITPAVTFPTTFNPIIQTGLTPVLVDVDLKTLNSSAEEIRKAVSPETKALFFPHTLGNPLEVDAIKEIAEEHSLFFLEDSCDALGSRYGGKNVGTFGNLSTFSFYPAHHMTTGEGGMVSMANKSFEPIVRSLRDWGRACVCPICLLAVDPHYICPMRFENMGEYDKRYTYINIGYNLKPLELQAAMGLEQLKKLPSFIEKRKKNYAFYLKRFQELEEFFILPESLPKADPCWFSFPFSLRDSVPFSRKELIEWLEKNNIESRLMFSGNIVRQPAYKNLKLKVHGRLKNADKIMKDTLFIGVYPALGREQKEFVVEKIFEFIKNHKN